MDPVADATSARWRSRRFRVRASNYQRPLSIQQGECSVRLGDGTTRILALILVGWLSLTRQVHDLGMGDRVLYTAEKFPRYIFYDGQLQRLPQSIWEAVKATFTMPLFSSLPSAILQDMNTPARPPELKDETIESFITRRFGARIAEDFVSSLVHGIYAGNISELSVRSIFPTAWHLEGDLSQAGGKGGGIFAASMFKWLEKKLRPGARKSQSLRELLELTTEQSLVAKVLTNLPMDVPIPTGGLWSLDQGMETLVHQLERYLGQFGNVTILKNQSIRNITSHEKSVEVCLHLTAQTTEDETDPCPRRYPPRTPPLNLNRRTTPTSSAPSPPTSSPPSPASNAPSPPTPAPAPLPSPSPSPTCTSGPRPHTRL